MMENRTTLERIEERELQIKELEQIERKRKLESNLLARQLGLPTNEEFNQMSAQQKLIASMSSLPFIMVILCLGLLVLAGLFGAGMGYGFYYYPKQFTTLIICCILWVLLIVFIKYKQKQKMIIDVTPTKVTKRKR